MKIYGSKLRAQRESRGLTQSDVACAVGVTKQAVQRWESGSASPRKIFTLEKIAKILMCDISEISDQTSKNKGTPIDELRENFEKSMFDESLDDPFLDGVIMVYLQRPENRQLRRALALKSRNALLKDYIDKNEKSRQL